LEDVRDIFDCERQLLLPTHRNYVRRVRYQHFGHLTSIFQPNGDLSATVGKFHHLGGLGNPWAWQSVSELHG